MTEEPGGSQDAGPPACLVSTCRNDADFWVYQPGGSQWNPRCRRHLVELHPSLEVNAWLESHYAKPIELDRPSSPPTPPTTGRAAAFREIVETAMQ